MSAVCRYVRRVCTVCERRLKALEDEVCPVCGGALVEERALTGKGRVRPVPAKEKP